MSTNDSYGAELNGVVIELRRRGANADVRSTGVGRFVYAKRDNRAIELYRDGDGWWLECWSGEAVASESSFTSLSEAVKATNSWFATNGA